MRECRREGGGKRGKGECVCVSERGGKCVCVRVSVRREGGREGNVREYKGAYMQRLVSVGKGGGWGEG